MAQNTTIDLPAGEWKELTNADVTAIRFQNEGLNRILVQGTVGAVAPTDRKGTIQYLPGEGQVKTDLVDLFPGVTGANRVWALVLGGPGHMSVSHE